MANFPNAGDATGASGQSAVQPTMSADGPVGGGNALHQGTVQINPEVLAKVPPLEGLDEIETVLIQPSQAWARWTEGLLINVVATLLVGFATLVLGMVLGSSSTGAGGGNSPHPAKGCVVAPVPDIKDRNG